MSVKDVAIGSLCDTSLSIISGPSMASSADPTTFVLKCGINVVDAECENHDGNPHERVPQSPAGCDTLKLSGGWARVVRAQLDLESRASI